MSSLTAGTVGKFALVLIVALVALKIVGWTLGILGALLGFLSGVLVVAFFVALLISIILLLTENSKKA